MEKDGESSWFKEGGTSKATWGWKRQADSEDVAVLPVAVSGSNVIFLQKSACSAASPHWGRIFSLEQVQRKAGGWSEGWRVSQPTPCLLISHSSDCTEILELVWKEMCYQLELFSINYFALNFMLVQLHKVIKPRCDVPAGWIYKGA